jgi:hypothetical protein
MTGHAVAKVVHLNSCGYISDRASLRITRAMHCNSLYIMVICAISICMNLCGSKWDVLQTIRVSGDKQTYYLSHERVEAWSQAEQRNILQYSTYTIIAAAYERVAGVQNHQCYRRPTGN